MKERSSLSILLRLGCWFARSRVGLALAVLLGLLGFACAIAVPVLGGFAALDALETRTLPAGILVLVLITAAVLRGFLRYGESKPAIIYIAFRLLALIRDRVFAALCSLAPASWYGHGKGALISLFTSDCGAAGGVLCHTISPVLMPLLLILRHAAVPRFLITGLLGIRCAACLCCGRNRHSALLRAPRQTAGFERSGEYAHLSSYLLDSLRGLKDTLHIWTGGQTPCRHPHPARRSCSTGSRTQKRIRQERSGNGFAVTFFSR